jgi:cobalt-zinc-cadmium efflux system outer membrane protein
MWPRPPGVWIVSLLGVVGCVRYHPAPRPTLDPARAATDYNARRLDDAVAVGIDSGWDDAQLAHAALHFRGEVTLGHALVAEARAGEGTAGARPGVGVEGSVTRTARPVETATSSWSEAITATVTLELGGKRGARIARARAATLAAGLRADAAEWELVQEVRGAAVDAVARDEEAADARQEERALQRVAGLFRARYVGGQLSFADVARADADAQAAAVSLSDAARARTEARLALARALAVPFDRVDTLRLRVARTSSCDLVESGGDSLAIAALRGRPDIGAALADYAVAEGDVRLEVARQYPDLTIGPGLLWDEGIPGWVVNAGLPALLLGRNRGAIREAEAHRATEAVRVRLLQDSVTAAVDGAIATCRGTRLGGATADSLVSATQRAADAARAAFDRGETGQTEVAVAELALVRAHRMVHLSNSRRVAAGAGLDRAVGRWIGLTERYP